MATVYILWSESLSRFYVGHTLQPMSSRLAYHNAGHVRWNSLDFGLHGEPSLKRRSHEEGEADQVLEKCGGHSQADRHRSVERPNELEVDRDHPDRFFLAFSAFHNSAG